jgi:hypothetical protein
MNLLANLIKFNSNEFLKTIWHKNTYAKPMHIYPLYLSFTTWKGNYCGGLLLEIIHVTYKHILWVFQQIDNNAYEHNDWWFHFGIKIDVLFYFILFYEFYEFFYSS